MILNETYTLANGMTIPKLGLGTWFIDDDKAAQAVREAVKLGYRLIDTAQAYGNERGVGEGVRTCGLPREQLFVASKVAAELKDYDTVVLGSPVWWYTFAPAVHSFLKEADLVGKRVYPFATNGGWLGHTLKDFAKACKGAEVKPGLDVRFDGARLRTPEQDILRWAKGVQK